MILELSQTFGLIDSSSHKFHEKYEREFGGKKNTINITIIFSSKPKKTKTKKQKTQKSIITSPICHLSLIIPLTTTTSVKGQQRFVHFSSSINKLFF